MNIEGGTHKVGLLAATRECFWKKGCLTWGENTGQVLSKGSNWGNWLLSAVLTQAYGVKFTLVRGHAGLVLEQQKLTAR